MNLYPLHDGIGFGSASGAQFSCHRVTSWNIHIKELKEMQYGCASVLSQFPRCFSDLETKVKGITLSNRGIKDVVYTTICP